MSAGPASPNPANAQAVREKTAMPGLVLLVVGLFNLLLSLWLVFAAIQSFRMSDEDLERRLEITRRWSGLAGGGEDQMPPAELLRQQTQIVSTAWAVLSLGAALLIILAGVRMRALRSYGLVAMGALTACIPFVSCTGCCGLGQVVGLWAVLVLLDPEVRQAFR